MKLGKNDLGAVCLIAIALYLFAALATYAFRNPELTGTQRVLHFWNAMKWEKSGDPSNE